MPIDPTSLDHDGDEDLDDEFDSDDDNIVTLQDADGNEQDFVFLTVVDLEGEGQFAALTPADEDDAAENTEIFLFRYEADEDGGESFTPINDENLYARVQAAAELHFAQAEEEETHDVALGDPDAHVIDEGED